MRFNYKFQMMVSKSINTLTLLLFLTTFLSAQSSPGNNDCACCSEPFRQFDFWLGDWEVTQNGNPAGTNSISIDQDSCLIVENWQSATSDYKGTSYNYYDNATKMWYQNWVDNKGGNLRLKGVYDNGKMVLMGDPVLNQKNQLTINKISWQKKDDGTVHQLWENSVDLGNSWQVLFDGIYKPKG